jgi:hypothetical protein
VALNSARSRAGAVVASTGGEVAESAQPAAAWRLTSIAVDQSLLGDGGEKPVDEPRQLPSLARAQISKGSLYGFSPRHPHSL